jgi:L-ascorbate metabolism protein UlaG (beta-lactamase superfamily)
MKTLAALVVMAFASSTASAAEKAGGAAKPARRGTTVTWYGQAAFVVKTPGGTVLAIDPWFSNPLAKEKGLQPPDKIDFILVTHGHADHVGDLMAVGKTTGARLVASNELAKALVAGGYPMDPQKITATAGNIGGTMVLTDEVSVTMVPAVHSSGYQKDAQSTAEAAGNPIGYFIHIKGGPRLYHTGDTAPFGEIESYARRWPIDVMMACIGGHFTMDPIGAAQHVAWAGAKQVIPMHFGTYPVLRGKPSELRSALEKGKAKAKMVEMKVGETRTF